MTTIKIKRGTGAPTSGDLDTAEMGLDTSAGVVYISTDGTDVVKVGEVTLDGTQTLTNKTLTSPTINTGITGTAVLDDDTFATASATTIATSESIKAYVDASGISGITSTATSTQIEVSDATTEFNNSVTFDEDILVHGNLTVGHGSTNPDNPNTQNSAFGKDALDSNTSGDYNTSLGFSSLYSNTSGETNVAVGTQALYFNTTGNKNTAVGNLALFNVTGNVNRNTAVGNRALVNLSSGSSNTAVGESCLDNLTSGQQNSSLGHYSNFTTTTGSNNSTLGYNAQPSSATVSNTITLGDGNITALRCNQTGITSLSDMRDKTNIADLSGSSNFIKNLEPVSFDWARRDETLQGVRAHGFLAQQLQSAQENTGYQVPGLVFDDNPDKLEATYGNLLPTIVAALKDALTEIDELKVKVAALESA